MRGMKLNLNKVKTSVFELHTITVIVDLHTSKEAKLCQSVHVSDTYSDNRYRLSDGSGVT